MKHDRPDRSATVLVVDDNPQVLEGMRALLENDGYRVLVAGSGRAALTLLRTGVQPGLVIPTWRCPAWTAGTSAPSSSATSGSPRSR